MSATFDAHGSLERWKEFRTLTFTYISERGERRDTQYITTDLWDRRELIKGKSADMGFDGQSYWKVMRDSSAANTDPKFMINLQFYFFAMPFVLADPGVLAESLAPRKLQGKSYEVTKISFGDSVGVAPKDQYILYTDPATKRLAYMLYSVTYYHADRAEQYSALHYQDWQSVDGLVLPRTVQRHAWNGENQTLGEERGNKYFSDVQFTRMPKSVYQKE